MSGETPMDTLMKACHCLHLEVADSIAFDVQDKARAVKTELDHLRQDNERLKGEVEAWRKEVEGSASGATLTTIKNLIAERDKAVSALATYKAAVVEARKLIKDVFGHYTQEDIEHLKTLYDKKVAGEYCVCDVLNAQTTLHTLSALTGDSTNSQ